MCSIQSFSTFCYYAQFGGTYGLTGYSRIYYVIWIIVVYQCLVAVCIGVAGAKFEGLHHVELAYDRIRLNAVTCSKDYIFVADSAPGGGVHIHSWNGQHTQSLPHAQLGLQSCRICAVLYHNFEIDGRRILQLAVGDYGSETVRSLHAYTVSDIQEVSLSDYMKSEDSISFQM